MAVHECRRRSFFFDLGAFHGGHSVNRQSALLAGFTPLVSEYGIRALSQRVRELEVWPDWSEEMPKAWLGRDRSLLQPQRSGTLVLLDGGPFPRFPQGSDLHPKGTFIPPAPCGRSV